MGSEVEFKDILKLTTEEGFPGSLSLNRHIRNPDSARDLVGLAFNFRKRRKPGEAPAIYHDEYGKTILVQDVDGKWLFWGHAAVTELTRTPEYMSGKAEVRQIYHPEFQRMMTIEESPDGKSYFDGQRTSYT